MKLEDIKHTLEQLVDDKTLLFMTEKLALFERKCEAKYNQNLNMIKRIYDTGVDLELAVKRNDERQIENLLDDLNKYLRIAEADSDYTSLYKALIDEVYNFNYKNNMLNNIEMMEDAFDRELDLDQEVHSGLNAQQLAEIEIVKKRAINKYMEEFIQKNREYFKTTMAFGNRFDNNFGINGFQRCRIKLDETIARIENLSRKSKCIDEEKRKIIGRLYTVDDLLRRESNTRKNLEEDLLRLKRTNQHIIGIVEYMQFKLQKEEEKQKENKKRLA